MEGKFNEYAKLIDGTLLTGIQKAWIWQHFAMTKFSWDFLVSDVPPSFVEATLQPIQTRFLKKWVGLAVKATHLSYTAPIEMQGSVGKR